MAGGGGGGDSGEPEFQIAPMIDVLLVLLIFFMSITSSQIEKSEKLDLAIAPNAQRKESAQNQVIVNIRWDAATQKPTFKVDDKEYKDVKLLADPLKQSFATNKQFSEGSTKFRALIRAERNVEALVVNRVMEVAGEAGIEEIAFGVYNKEGD